MHRLKILGLVLCVLLAATAVAFFIVKGVGVSKLASRGGGAIPTAADLEYPELTDSENAAFLYRAAWRELEATPEGANTATLMLMSRYVDTLLARDGLSGHAEDALSDSDLRMIPLLLSEAEPAFELLRQARATKGCLFLDDHGPEAVNDNLIDFLDTGKLMRNLARYLAARAFWEAEQGNTDAALDWTTTGLHLANDLSDESVLIGELIRIAIGGMMLSAAQGILYNHPIPEPTPQVLLDELADLRDRRHYGDSLRREGALSEALSKSQWQGARWNPLPGMWEGSYLDSLSAFIRAVETDDYTNRTLKLEKLSDGVARSSTGIMKYFHMYEAILLPALMRSDEALETLIAKIDLLQLGLSLRVYEQTHGEFPDTLAELTPEYLAAVPEDPLNGKEYLYEQSAERVTVRSEAITRRGEIAFHLAPTIQVADSP